MRVIAGGTQTNRQSNRHGNGKQQYSLTQMHNYAVRYSRKEGNCRFLLHKSASYELSVRCRPPFAFCLSGFMCS